MTELYARRLTIALGGRWFGSYGYARCVVHEDRRPSLRLRDGHNSRLLVRCESGCEARDILCELRHRGLLDGASAASPPPSPAVDLKRREATEHDERQRIERALAIWRQSVQAEGTPAEAYLRGRAIVTPAPRSIRFHPRLKHGPTGLFLPAMVAAVQASDGRITGVHRTFIKHDGSGKAIVSEAKLSLGLIAGGAIRLGAAGRDLAIGEGIETCLSFMQAHRIPAWSALSAGNLCSVIVPPLPIAAIVYICQDLDANRAGEKAAERAAERLSSEGRTVKIATPFAGKDMNDALQVAARG